MLRIAVIVDREISEGGGFQHLLSLCTLLQQKNSQRFEFIFFTDNKSNPKIFYKLGIKLITYTYSPIIKFFDSLKSNINIHYLLHKIRPDLCKSKFEKMLVANQIDLVFFPSPSQYAQWIGDLNFVYTIWDICHLEWPIFPEVRNNLTLEKREQILSLSCKKAFKVIVDSPISKTNIIQCYNLLPTKVFSIPFIASIETQSPNLTIDIRTKYNIRGKYIYYPAQLWPHKNHKYIVDVIAALKEDHNIELDAVFSGSDKGNWLYIKQMAEKKNISHLIHYLGLVPNEDVPILYKESIALVMPTFFGPTNIPPLEAFSLDTVVCYPKHLKDGLGDAALYFDITDSATLVQILLNVLNNKIDKNLLIKKGKEKLSECSKENYWQNLENIFTEYEQINRIFTKKIQYKT